LLELNEEPLEAFNTACLLDLQALELKEFGIPNTKACDFLDYETELVWNNPIRDIENVLNKVEIFNANGYFPFILKAIQRWALNIPFATESAEKYWRQLESRADCLKLMELTAKLQRYYLRAVSYTPLIPNATSIVSILSFSALATKISCQFYPGSDFQNYINFGRWIALLLDEEFISKPLFYIHHGYLDQRLQALQDWFKEINLLMTVPIVF
jgi:hypothetical protein